MVLWLVVWILPQDKEVLDYTGLWNVLFCSQFCTLCASNEDWSVMSLETCDLLCLTSLTDCIYCVTYSDLGLNWLQFFIQSDEHAWVDRQSQVVEEVMVLATDESLHISGGHEDCQQTSKTHIREQEFVRVERIQAKQTLYKIG